MLEIIVNTSNGVERKNKDFKVRVRKHYLKRAAASSCRELLNQIRSMKYVVSDSDALHDLQDGLTDLLEALQKKAPEENVLVVETVQPKRKLKHAVLPELPKPKRLKSSITNQGRCTEDDCKGYSKFIIRFSTGFE